MHFWGTVSPALIVGLVLSGSVVTGCSSDDPEFHRGIAGESCRARNDCQSGLACINEKCSPDSPHLSVTGKACYRVECADKADCCADFVPAAGCDVYQKACQANPNDCEAFLTLCQYNRTCTNELCVDVGPGCRTNADCTTISSPYCVETRCVECREHGDCPSGKERCISGTCQALCETNENCPPLHSCEAGTCVPSGCTSDRECVFHLGHQRGRCMNGTCFVGCSVDAECNARNFEVCHEGRCTFVGCESHEECRVYLDLSDTQDNIRAECR